MPRQLHSWSQELPIPDGGGASSTADWLQPRVSEDLFRGLRRKFEALAMEWGAVPRVLAHMRDPSDQSIFSVDEVKRLRVEMVSFLRSHGFDCTDAVEPHQPFLLSVWQALAT